MKFLATRSRSGAPIYVNPARIMYLAHSYGDPESTAIVLSVHSCGEDDCIVVADSLPTVLNKLENLS